MPTAVPIDPTKLIEAATEFANAPVGAGRPRPVWLRRAVSSAYYALYHSLAVQAAQHVLPNGSQQDQLRLARSFDHGSLRDACGWIAGRGKSPVHAQSIVQGLRNTAIDDVANAFIDLQELRHAADYDHLSPFPKATVLAAVQDAVRAIQKLDGAPAPEKEALFALLSLKTSLR